MLPLVGVYVPTRWIGLAYKNQKPSHIELRSDSSFVAENMPAVWSPFSVQDGFEKARGRWSVRKHQNWWSVQLEVQAVEGADGRLSRIGYTTSAMLLGWQEPYKLHISIGDPDEGRALQYELK